MLKELSNINETMLFWETMERIKGNYNVNLLNLVYDELPHSSKAFIEGIMTEQKGNTSKSI